MIRIPAVLFLVGSLAWGQSLATKKAFLHEVDALRSRMLNGEPIDPLARLQEEIGISASSAAGVIETVKAYNAAADNIESRLGRSILTRRLQIAGEYKVTYSSELDLVNWANLDLNLLLFEGFDDLRSRMGADEYEKLAQFMEAGSSRDYHFPFRPGETGRIGRTASVGWKMSPAAFWRGFIRDPLSSAQAEDLFSRSYKGVPVPAPDIVPYLEGTVVSVTPEDSQGRRLLLSMDDDDESAEAALLIDGEHWTLRREPEKGAVVRFSGVPLELTLEPFLVLFAPERITGLPVESDRPNAPFTAPGLAR